MGWNWGPCLCLSLICGSSLLAGSGSGSKPTLHVNIHHRITETSIYNCGYPQKTANSNHLTLVRARQGQKEASKEEGELRKYYVELLNSNHDKGLNSYIVSVCVL